mgnify:CR=1 FL=1
MSSFKVYFANAVLGWCIVPGGCRHLLSLQSGVRTLQRTKIVRICGFQFQKPTDSYNKYFFFGFGTSERCFFNYLGCVLPASGSVGKLIAFSEASLHTSLFTLPRYLPLIYLFTTIPCLFLSSTTVSSKSLTQYIGWGCAPPYEFNYLTIKYQYKLTPIYF